MKKEYYLWLKEFKKYHNLKSINETIYKLIDIYKAHNIKIANQLEKHK